MKVVIEKNETQGHIISKYKFRVFNAKEEVTTRLRQEDTVEPSVSQETIQEHELTPNSKDELVESLLKKVDDMSSNFIKLQMKLEEKEEEFAQRLEKEKQEAYDKGFEEGKASASTELEELKSTTIERFTKSIESLEKSASDFERSLEKIENELINAALDIAKEVIEIELSQNSAAVASKLASVLIEDLKSSAKITLKVNPNDLAIVSEKVGKLPHVSVVADSAIAQGGVVAVSDSGNVDSEIMNRYERVKKAALGG